jgi:serine/threonine protein kinase
MKTRGSRIGGYRVLGTWAGRDGKSTWVVRAIEEGEGGEVYTMRAISGPQLSDLDRSALVAAADSVCTPLHRQIARVHDLFEDPEEGIVYLVSELVQGESLREVMRVAGEVPRMFAVGVAARIAQLLERAQARARETESVHHAAHGDLSSSSIIFTHEGELKLIDYGLAHLTSGTIGRGTVDPRDDVHALGRVLADVVRAGSRRSTSGIWVPKGKSATRTGSTRELDAIIARATAPERSARYRDAGALWLDLDSYLKSRAPGYDTKAEINRLMTRFQHKARATRTLIARWTAQASITPRPSRLVSLPIPTPAPALLETLPRALPPELPLADSAIGSARTDDILASRTQPGMLRAHAHPQRAVYLYLGLALLLIVLLAVLAVIGVFD